MASFELKPMETVNERDLERVGNMNTGLLKGAMAEAARIDLPAAEIMWTHQRSSLPALFVGRRVPQDVWEATFDALSARYDEQHEFRRVRTELMKSGLPFLLELPLCLCVLVKQEMAKEKVLALTIQQSKAWEDLERTEQLRLRPYGVEVSIAKEICGTARSTVNQAPMVHVGLKFNLLADPAMMPDVAVEEAAVAVAVAVAV